MKLKTLMNADVLQENPKNKVELEHITGIVPNAEYFVEHSIYFADSLKVFSDADKTNYLIEGTDYEFAEMDTIASEQSNSECYRAIVFLTDIPEAFISYHSYGDIVSAETLNDIVNEVNTSMDNNLSLGNEIEKLKNDFDVHTKSTKEHGTTDTVKPATIALRTLTGAMKVAEPVDADDAVTKNFQEVKIQESENKMSENLNATRKEIMTDIEKLEDKVKAKTPVVEVKDFYPDGMSADDVEDLPNAEKEKIILEAKKELEKKVSETKAYFNVIRNATGSITVPEAVADTDAVNNATVKKLETNFSVSIKDVESKINSFRQEFNTKVTEFEKKITTVELSFKNALTNEVASIKNDFNAKIQKMKERIKVLELNAGYTDEYKFDGTVFETNKTWNGKKIYRVGLSFKSTGNPISMFTGIFPPNEIISLDGHMKTDNGISFFDKSKISMTVSKNDKTGNDEYFLYFENYENNKTVNLFIEFI